MTNDPKDLQHSTERVEHATEEAESRLAELDDQEDPRIGAAPTE